MTIERANVGWGLWLQWVLASTVGGAVGLAVGDAVDGALGDAVDGAVFGTVFGAITGVALVWLLRQPVPKA